MKPKAYSYLRFSTPEQLKGDSLRRQSQLAADYVATHGLELDTELNMKDLGVSAFRGDNLATGALGAFLDAVHKGIVPQGSFLLVESLDRVSRKAASRAANVLQSICYAGVKVVTLTDGRIYDEKTLDDDPISFIYAVLIFFRAHEESATKARRLKAAWHGKRSKAHTHALTALTPGWIKLDASRVPVLIEERAKVVKRIVKDYMRGVGRDGIAVALNREHVPTFGKAKHWRRSYIAKILESPALVGTFVPHMQEHREGRLIRIPQAPVPGYFPAVLDAETYERLQELNGRSPLRGRHAHAPMKNILSGLARCPKCGQTMTRVTKGARTKAGRPFLVCSKAKEGAGCTYKGVACEDVEAALMRDYEHLLREMPHPDAAIDRELQSAQVAVEELEHRMGELMNLVERHASDTLARRVVALEASLKDATQARDEALERAAQSERKIVQMKCDALGVAIRARPLDRARVNAALRALFSEIVVDYRRGYLCFKWLHDGVTEMLYTFPEEERA